MFIDWTTKIKLSIHKNNDLERTQTIVRWQILRALDEDNIVGPRSVTRIDYGWAD